jgi:tetratricopeptide (TPR) repeat protein
MEGGFMAKKNKIEQDDPCPCGSGKKYKDCCLARDEGKAKNEGKAGASRAKSIARAEAGANSKQPPKKGKQVNQRQAKEKTFPGFKDNGNLDYPYPDAQEIVYDGWELLDSDPREAAKYFKKALQSDPDLPDAYNGLAELALSRGRIKEAEQLYKTAYEKARQRLGTEDPKALAWWLDLSTRPYMRARQGLGLLYQMLGRYDEAIKEFKELLLRNPNDNQGVRYLIAPAYLLKGDVGGAIREFEWYQKDYGGDRLLPDFCLNWALALFLAGRYEEAAAKIRSTIFLNPYLIPLVLGQEPEVLPIWHWINLMGLDYAEEYLDWYEELWLENEEALSFLSFVWEDPAIRRDYKDWIYYGAALKEMKEPGHRRRIIELQRKIERKKLSKSFLLRLEKYLADKANKNRIN